MTPLTVSPETISHLSAADITQLVSRLEWDDYANPFEALADWHLLRAIAFQRHELVEPYQYLLDNNAYDES